MSLEGGAEGSGPPSAQRADISRWLGFSLAAGPGRSHSLVARGAVSSVRPFAFHSASSLAHCCCACSLGCLRRLRYYQNSRDASCPGTVLASLMLQVHLRANAGDAERAHQRLLGQGGAHGWSGGLMAVRRCWPAMAWGRPMTGAGLV